MHATRSCRDGGLTSCRGAASRLPFCLWLASFATFHCALARAFSSLSSAPPRVSFYLLPYSHCFVSSNLHAKHPRPLRTAIFVPIFIPRRISVRHSLRKLEGGPNSLPSIIQRHKNSFHAVKSLPLLAHFSSFAKQFCRIRHHEI